MAKVVCLKKKEKKGWAGEQGNLYQWNSFYKGLRQLRRAAKPNKKCINEITDNLWGRLVKLFFIHQGFDFVFVKKKKKRNLEEKDLPAHLARREKGIGSFVLYLCHFFFLLFFPFGYKILYFSKTKTKKLNKRGMNQRWLVRRRDADDRVQRSVSFLV